MFGPYTFGAVESVKHTLTSLSEKPSKIFVAFKVNEGFNKVKRNSFVYNHCEVKRINLRINNQIIPDNSYTADFVTDNDYVLLFNELMKASDKVGYEGGSQIDYASFKDLYTFYAWDLRENLKEIVFHKGVTQDITVNADFVRAPRKLTVPGDADDGFKMFVFIESERELVLDVVSKQMLVSQR